MVIEEFQSPFDTPTPLDYNQNSLIAHEGKRGIIGFPQNDSTSPHPFHQLKIFGRHLTMEVC
jgi:hypothetical protein